MEEVKVSDTHMTSAAAFVEGGIQDACDDACSICLEDFCDSDPSTLTTCKHEYHLQCILECFSGTAVSCTTSFTLNSKCKASDPADSSSRLAFKVFLKDENTKKNVHDCCASDIFRCQRSSQCPMCWQAISLKDPGSQELLDAVEHERNIRMNPPPRNTTIFHHPTLGDFELQHLPVSANDSELEERIIQHLAAAAAMGRARHLARREGQRNSSRSSAQGRPRYLVFSTHPDGSSNASPGSSINLTHGGNPPPPVMLSGPNPPFITIGEDSADLIAQPASPQAEQLMVTPTRTSGSPNRTSSSNRSPSQSSPNSQDRAGPSDFQAFSESVKSRLGALSMRCKESITKNTRGWKDRLFTRNSSTPEPSPEICGEADQRPANVSRMMDHLEIAEDPRTSIATTSNMSDDNSTQERTQERSIETGTGPSVMKHEPEASRATCSSSN